MRLQEIYSICKKTQEVWVEMVFEEVNAPGIVYQKLKNPDAVRVLLSVLEPIEFFAENIAGVKRTSLGFTQTSGAITFDKTNKAQLLSEYSRLKNKVMTVTDLFESMHYGQASEGFDIKLPKDISLSELSRCTHDLDIIFSTCPLFADQQENVTFKAVDIGSIWLNFAIVGATVTGTLKILAELVDKVLIIRSHYLTCKEQEEKARSLKLSNDVLENLIQTNKAIGNGLLEQVSTELATQHEITDPEAIGRLNNSIKLLYEWMSKGMEIYASIQASPEIKAVFPPIEKQALPEGAVGMLADGSDKEE